jgi:serine/threonine protein kinase
MVSHFRVFEPIAVGGMGVVYRAEDALLGRAVALKLPLPERWFERDARERFVREGRAAGGLDHPNVCAIHEVGETSAGHLYIAMALYPGETLAARIARDGPLGVSDALSIARSIARGLAAATPPASFTAT